MALVQKVSKGIDFDSTMPGIYWSDITRASYLQRMIIVHSILYYQMNTSVISDGRFDRLSKQLIGLRSQMTAEEYRRAEYYYCFQDFDGNTGFDLYNKLVPKDREWLTKLAEIVLVSYKSGK